MSDLYARIVLFLIRPALRLHKRSQRFSTEDFFAAARECGLLDSMPIELVSDLAQSERPSP